MGQQNRFENSIKCDADGPAPSTHYQRTRVMAHMIACCVGLHSMQSYKPSLCYKMSGNENTKNCHLFSNDEYEVSMC